MNLIPKIVRSITLFGALATFNLVYAGVAVDPAVDAGPEFSGEVLVGEVRLSLPIPTPELIGDTWVSSLFLQNEFFQISGDFAGKPDPFVAYALGITNFTNAPLTFHFFFSTPYVGGQYNLLESSHQMGVTDSGPSRNSNVTVTEASAPTNFIHNPALDGVNIAGANLSTGCNLTGSPGFSAPCFSAPNVLVSVLSQTSGTLSLRLDFTLSARDAATSSGRAELLTPEPSYSIVGLLSMAGFFVARRRIRG